MRRGAAPAALGSAIAKARDSPRVSVVIPTFRRPGTLLRALLSVLGQTLETIEVIVVVDGRDDETLRVLGSIDDTRVRTIVPDRHLGNADARNAAVREARSPWVAFVDDDDEWMPRKLADQLWTAERSTHEYPIVSCRMIGRNEYGDFLWPRRRPRAHEPVSEYLFCRSTPFAGEGMLQTSTILTARTLLERVPFRSGLRRYVDLDWILRATTVEGVGIEFPPGPDPLSVWHMQHNRPRVSNGADSAFTLAWARERRSLFTPRSYASFVMTLGSRSAGQSNDWKTFLALGVEAYRHGAPRAMDVLGYVAYFAVPDRVQGRLAAAYARRTADPAPALAPLTGERRP